MDFKFWFRVDVGDEDECWEFLNQPSQRYGVYNLKVDGGWKAVRPHRYAYELSYGEIADGLYVCHSCDNPKCCNPNHLWLGTNSDNQRDAVEKYGHWRIHPERSLPKGVDHHSAKLDPQKVRIIRKRYAAGETQDALAVEFGVTQTMISKIVRRQSWKDV